MTLQTEEKRIKTEKLDTAFLFGLASIGLIIAFLETNKDLASAVEAIPFLFLGVLLPFLVGYMRGAIELDSVEERLRGWIYFLIGTTSYSSYLLINWLHAAYIFEEAVFISIIIFGLVITYVLLRWSKKVFGVSGVSCQYAFSGTMLSAITIAFINRFVVALFFDYHDKMHLLFSENSESFFWFSIVMFALSIFVILEKASTNAVNAELELPKFEGKLRKIMLSTPIKGLIFGFVLLEYAFDYNLETFFIWSQAFALWTLGCFLWVAGIPLFPQTFFMIASFFTVIAIIAFCKLEAIRYNRIENTGTNKTSYMLLIFVSMFSMALSRSLISGLVLFVLITLHELLPKSKKKKRT